MLTKRIIPCLDIKDGRTVKGVNFINLVDAGDPVENAKYYSENGADELVFLDITATKENRKTFAELVEKIAKNINIPFTVGGGITSVDDVKMLLSAGADKISVNSSAVRNPDLIKQLSNKFGSQCVVVAIDAKKMEDNKWKVYLVGGRKKTDIDLFDWAKEAEKLGAGEILFTSMNNDGTKKGFANDGLSKLSQMLKIPIIASGGAGSMNDFADTFIKGKSDAALAASVFHFNQININELKLFLYEKNIDVRI